MTTHPNEIPLVRRGMTGVIIPTREAILLADVNTAERAEAFGVQVNRQTTLLIAATPSAREAK